MDNNLAIRSVAPRRTSLTSTVATCSSLVVLHVLALVVVLHGYDKQETQMILPPLLNLVIGVLQAVPV
jgi:hypothetical protein